MEEMAEGEVIGLVCVQVPDRPLLLLLQLGPAVLVEGERDNGGQQEIMSHNKEWESVAWIRHPWGPLQLQQANAEQHHGIPDLHEVGNRLASDLNTFELPA